MWSLGGVCLAGLALLIGEGDPARLRHLDAAFVKAAIEKMKTDVEAVLDRMKPSAEPIPAVLVGGGSVLLDGQLVGTSVSLRPDHFGSANAIGAAIAQVSGEVDRVVSLEGTTRVAALEQIVNDARARAACG